MNTTLPSKNQYYLDETIVSTFTKGYIYGFAGELVTEVSVLGSVVIVQGKTERFPVPKEKLIIKKHK